MTELNPCPGCGNEPDLKELHGAFVAYCSKCSNLTEVTSVSANGAINGWNAATGEQPVKTLRDEFAMAVLNGAIAANSNHRPVSYDDLAADCYSVADAMLKERSK